jgi:hypothetical protein
MSLILQSSWAVMHSDGIAAFSEDYRVGILTATLRLNVRVFICLRICTKLLFTPSRERDKDDDYDHTVSALSTGANEFTMSFVRKYALLIIVFVSYRFSPAQF